MTSLALVTPQGTFAGYPSYTATREAALGLLRVDNGDGTFHYALPAGASTADQVGTIFTWRYEGQANFPWVPAAHVPRVSADDEPDTGDDPSEGLDALPEMQKVDELGRKWRAVTVDHVQALYAIADYYAEVESAYGLETDPGGAEPAQDLDASDAVVRDIHLRAWDFRDCNADPGSDVSLYDGDDRIRFNSGGTGLPPGRQGLLVVRSPLGHCTGVFVDEAKTTVLTAAHCVTQGLDGRPWPDTSVQISSSLASSSFCVDARDMIPAPAWPGADHAETRHFRHDWALVFTGSGLPDPPMVFSKDSRAKIKKRTPVRIGADVWELDAAGGCQAIPAPTASEHPAVPVRGTRGGLLRLRADDATGGSDGPWFFEEGGVGRIIAVHAAARPGPSGTGWTGGPRVTEFRNVVIVVTANQP